MATQPDAADLIDQGNTYRCGPYSVLQWWSAAGHRAACESVITWPYACEVADVQQGASFGQVLALVIDWSWRLGVPIRLFGDGYCRDFATFQQLCRDNWCLTVGVYEQDLVDPAHPEYGPQQYFHFLDVNSLVEDPAVYGVPAYTVSDPFHKYSGEDGVASVESMHEAIRHNWDPAIICVAWRFD